MNPPELFKPELPKLEDVKTFILQFCFEPRSKNEILEYIKGEITPANNVRYIRKLVKNRFLQITNPRFPKAFNQTYVITQKGILYLPEEIMRM